MTKLLTVSNHIYCFLNKTSAKTFLIIVYVIVISDTVIWKYSAKSLNVCTRAINRCHETAEMSTVLRYRTKC